ncbi:hypothetical protein HY310_01450 [Candidatus Microgenomates bacterium]|nr:hypothetical protein [Candidatus Microgenomates bacterium]
MAERIPSIAIDQFSKIDNLDKAAKTLWGLYELNGAMGKKLLTYGHQRLEISKTIEKANEIFLSNFGPKGRLELEKNCYLGHDEESLDVFVNDSPKITIVGFAGLPQSGKGACGEIMRQNYNSRHYAFIEGLFAFAYAMGLDPTKMSRAELREKVNDVIKPRLGNDTFANAVIHRGFRIAVREGLSVVTCDGFRSVDEGKLVRDVIPNGILVGVESSLWNRYQRAKHKPQVAQRPKSFAQFVWDSFYENKTMIGPVLKMTDTRFDNNRDLEYLRRQVVAHFNTIL